MDTTENTALQVTYCNHLVFSIYTLMLKVTVRLFNWDSMSKSDKGWYFVSWLFGHPLILNTGAPIGCVDSTLGVGDPTGYPSNPGAALYVILMQRVGK